MTLPTARCCSAALLLSLTAAVQAQNPCASPGARIIAWWDAAPNGINRAIDLVDTTDTFLQNGASFGAMPGFGPDAFLFDGQDDHLASVQEMTGLDANDWTFEGWIRPTRLGVFQGIVSKFEPITERAGDFALVATPDGRIQFRYRTNASGGNTELNFETPPVLAAGTATHVSVTTLNGSGFRIHVDGQLQTLRRNGPSFGALPNGGNDRSTFVGCVLPGSQHFEGQMDELTFYDRALPTSELLDIAQAGNALKCKDAAPLPAGAVVWYDGTTCRNHALDRVGLEAAPLNPSIGATVTIGEGIVGDGFDLSIGGGLNTERPLLRTTGPFTIEMWVFRRRNNAEEVLYSELTQQGRVAGECILRFADGSIRLVRATGIGTGGEGVSSRLPIPLNQWTHIAAVFAGPGDLRLFVNGERNDAPVGAFSGFNDRPRGTSAGFGVGTNSFPFLRAAVDECTLYRSAVSEAEIDAIYRAGRFGKEAPTSPPLDCLNGTLEDLELEVTLSERQVLAPPSLQFAASDVFFVNMQSPAGTFTLSPYGILAQAFDASSPPVAAFPGFQLELGSAVFIAGGLTPSAFGLPLLNPAGTQVALVVPPTLAGIRVRIQGFVLDPLTNNGTFAATDPIDLQIRAAGAGPGS